MFSPLQTNDTDTEPGRSFRTVRRPLYAGAAALITVLGVAACASAQQNGTAGAGQAGSAPVGATASAGPGSATAGPTAPVGTAVPANPVTPSTVNPGGPLSTPQAQSALVPAGSTLVTFESVTKSSDGMTVYLGATAGGGACGQYDVVVQETSTTVKLGLAHITPGKAVPCPMFVRETEFPAHLSSALGNRQVFDLAGGQSVGSGGSIPVEGADVPKLPQ